MKLVFFWQGENNSKSVNCIVVMPLLQKRRSQIQISLSDVTAHSVLTRFSQSTFFSAGNSNSSLVRKIQKVSIVVVPLLHGAKYKCLHQMWQCTVGDFWQKAKLSPLDTIFWTNLGWGQALHTGRLLKIRVTTDWHDTVSAQWDSHPHDNFHLTRFFSLDTCVNLTVNSSMQC